MIQVLSADFAMPLPDSPDPHSGLAVLFTHPEFAETFPGSDDPFADFSKQFLDSNNPLSCFADQFADFPEPFPRFAEPFVYFAKPLPLY